MSEEIKPIKSERIDNSDGSYIVKEVLEENNYGFLSVIQYFDSNNLLIKEQNFSDDNFENLVITSNTIYKNNKKIESHDVYEQDQGGWYSIIGKYDLKGRLVQIQEFTDKEFKNLFITETRKYDIFNNWVSTVIQENNSVWAKRFYKNGKLIKEKRYDKERNKIQSVRKYKYYKNGHYKIFEKWDSHLYDICEYDEMGNIVEWIYNSSDTIKRKIKWQYINGEKCKEIEYENNKLKSTTDSIYDENNNKLIEEKILYYEPNKEKYSSVIKKYNIEDKSVCIKYYTDNRFQNLLKTEEEYKIDGGTMTFGKYTDASAKIKSYKIENKKNITKLYYTDNSFNTLYATWHKKFSDNEMEEITIIEEPTAKIMPFDDNNYEISTQFSAIIGNLKNDELYVTFFSDKDFKDPVCYLKNSKTSKNGNKCLFYNEYPQENYVEVRKYNRDKLIYKKQYKKFKFLAKLRYYLGI